VDIKETHRKFLKNKIISLQGKKKKWRGKRNQFRMLNYIEKLKSLKLRHSLK
jgi:hypothetical protein